MGPENSGGQFVAYIDGQPVEIGQTLAEITPDYSAGGVSAEEAGATMAAVSTAWANLSMTIEVAAGALRDFFAAAELATAVRLARIFEPAMAHRYLHTKKKRTRKKYEKKILAWYREEVAGAWRSD